MEKVTVTARHCYGIPRLEHTFDFSNNNAPVVVYAPNGLMKTSLAKSARDYSQGNDPKDEVFPERPSTFSLEDEEGNAVHPESVFVVDSINEKYRSERISTLLASEALKSEYDSIYNEIAEKLESFLKKLRNKSGIKKGIEKAFCDDYQLPETQLMIALARLEREVKSGENSEFGEFDYKVLVNPKVEDFISKPEFSELISDYSTTYEQILDRSKYFKKGVFNHSNAEQIAKNLKSNGWFEGGHTVRLNDGSVGVEIANEKQLEKAIEDEKAAILNNEELQKSFEKVDKALSNAELRTFREYIVKNPTLIPELKNYAYLKNKLWVGYLQKLSSEYFDLVECYDRSQKKLRGIVAKAETETTRWEGVLEIFNARFSVPFKVAIENKSDAVLGISSPQIVFYFDEANNGGQKKVDKALLDRVLSNGERRALYILNIIFEVEARRASGIETLFLVDDIADSFDYKNKYAIIEYLSDMRQEEQFRLIIMTHNFDFYRTTRSRLSVYGDNKLLASRELGRISLQPDELSQNPFLQWRDNLNDRVYVVAAIPFVRNLAEYTGQNDVFLSLTSLLHIKTGSQDITLSDVKRLFGRILPTESIALMQDSTESTLNVIFEVCDVLAAESDDLVSLHEKVVLAIGIRLRAENALITLIDDNQYVASISSNQTGKLIRKFERDNPGEATTLALMRKVSLMTPENIHLNSFMFEPILDMSSHHLQSLYCELKQLNESLQD